MLQDEVAGARERGAAVVMVSHSLSRDLATADYVLHLDGNRAAFAGPARDFVPPRELAC
jgi:heme exporter protein A